ncbi:signal peptidase II [Candidatus Curtissbacteria bacterium]|nr:signal peptidase II [Candidatus Curtissbacteria bacterium]
MIRFPKQYFAQTATAGLLLGFFNLGLLNIIAPIIILFACFYFLLRQKRRIIAFALVLVAGGGASNLIDRLTFGCVRDFIDLTWISPRLALWPSFNLADSAVSAGVTILIFAVLIKSKAKKSNVSIH